MKYITFDQYLVHLLIKEQLLHKGVFARRRLDRIFLVMMP